MKRKDCSLERGFPMHVRFSIQAAAAIVGIVALSGPTKATTLVLSSPYNANLIWNNNGTVSLISDPTTDYTAVQAQSELWSNFTSGSSLPAGALLTLGFSTVGGVDHHTISFFDSAFGSTAGTFTWGYDVSEIASYRSVEHSVSGDILQTSGSSTLVANLVDNFSNAYALNFTQVGTVTSGITSQTFAPGVTMLSVKENLSVASGGSDIAGISNSFVEAAIPEASTWTMLCVGFALMGAAGFGSSRGRGRGRGRAFSALD